MGGAGWFSVAELGDCGVWLGGGWWRDFAGGVAGWEGLGQLWGVPGIALGAVPHPASP